MFDTIKIVSYLVNMYLIESSNIIDWEIVHNFPLHAPSSFLPLHSPNANTRWRDPHPMISSFSSFLLWHRLQFSGSELSYSSTQTLFNLLVPSFQLLYLVFLSLMSMNRFAFSSCNPFSIKTFSFFLIFIQHVHSSSSSHLVHSTSHLVSYFDLQSED